MRTKRIAKLMAFVCTAGLFCNTQADMVSAQELSYVDWISQKEAEATRAGAEWGGGSMRSLVENTTAARITRKRVYELAEYLR